jgi:hypothetical protein
VSLPNALRVVKYPHAKGGPRYVVERRLFAGEWQRVTEFKDFDAAKTFADKEWDEVKTAARQYESEVVYETR